ncbi:DUF3788 family protein [Propionicimonas sp.]|uniref:DUF3788 family protein n=1 Tax=Propionicimonas sp. TaxID=1955623 RepID=UPI00184D41C4|nr:DUF3788 family protein [Propionicimonas sp.]MBU3977056.1 DUF3788 domain-containing protein [Actinomycetota bacterium]MBA3020626.1 DUF3788 family protein [Propionicimonas sp.]MBU3984996.1 DUF3788 domain-containing protein [Actinomycetota bacterium]MBU4007047.1 DUF3788 domain-containing protein [Actinomycetota bacterium]MBU4064800.1 DUF3788 domain-containing protein [Actinomycetota bacterium]
MSQAFNEEATRPTPESIAAALGDAASVWATTVAALEEVGATAEWRYYRDGGWLAKATKRSQTIAWARVEPGQLRVSFYFAARFRELLLDEMGIDAAIREQVEAATGRTIALSLELGATSAPEQLLALIGFKLRAK